MTEIRLPVAEMMATVQGEGQFTGTPMHFLRLAGCNVGQYIPPTQLVRQDLRIGRIQFPMLPICTTALNQEFLCDTDYHAKEGNLSIAQILSRIPAQTLRVCVTGGEPFIHEHLRELVEALLGRGLMVHFETSGTKPIPDWVLHGDVWIACSPKKGFLMENVNVVDEFKFVIDARDHMSVEAQLQGILAITSSVIASSTPVYLSPANYVNELEPGNLARVVELCFRNPAFRINTQMHKLWKMR